ncbi:MAG TPA: Gx transporter family protein [Oscillospiraceae bacterium]|nr:Gx transporter family protein [Oscillospiraceae bacterium]
MKKTRMTAQKTALLGILAAEAIALSFLEGLLPPFLPVQGMRIGLSNIITMFSVLSLGISHAVLITLFKVFFVLITRGVQASLLSLAGGLLSLLGMAVLLKLKPNRLGLIGVGIVSALLHNSGQLFVSVLILGKSILSFAPALIAISVLTGALTGTILYYTIPFLQKQCAHIINNKNQSDI